MILQDYYPFHSTMLRTLDEGSRNSNIYLFLPGLHFVVKVDGVLDWMETSFGN